MKYFKWLSILASLLLIISCFMPWVVIESRAITVSGVVASGTNYGRPGYFHLTLVLLYLLFSVLPRIWAKRINLVVAAINLGWALRNYFVISACQAGDCPDKKTGIYLMLIASVLMLVSAMFPDMKMPAGKMRDQQTVRKSD